MPRDYQETIRALRAKANDRATGPDERAALLAKANEMEAKYGNSNSGSTDDTTIFSRDGRGRWVPWTPPVPAPTHTAEFWREYLTNLAARQWMWNTEYYDRDGNPVTKPDVDNIYEEEYRYEPEEEDG